MKRPILLTAMVKGCELDATTLAADLLQKSLTAAGEPIEVRCGAVGSLEEAERARDDAIVITSLLPEVEKYAEAWTTVEQRLKDHYAALSQNSSRQIFVCTVFRHVGESDRQDSSEKLIRIRQLNRLAANLSHQYGVLVIDVDRELANVGARRLQTDYHLGGPLVATLVGRSIALAILSAGLDEYVSFDIQDQARIAILNDISKIHLPAMTDVAPSNTLALSSGRHRQVVKTIVDNNSQNHASWLIHLLLTGKLGVGDAAKKLQKSIARRGLGASTVLLLSAARDSLLHRNRLGQ